MRTGVAHAISPHLGHLTSFLFSFPDAGHAVVLEEFQAFRGIMTQTVLPGTYPSR